MSRSQAESFINYKVLNFDRPIYLPKRNRKICSYIETFPYVLDAQLESSHVTARWGPSREAGRW